VATGSALFVVALGLIVLAGWFSHTTALIQFKPHMPPMTRNAAACFLLCGLALLTVIFRGPSWLVVVSAGIVSAGSVLTIVEYVFRVNIGIDELLGPSYLILKESSPGRMAPVTAICFALGSSQDGVEAVGAVVGAKWLAHRRGWNSGEHELCSGRK
jgi:hypothetical protein